MTDAVRSETSPVLVRNNVPRGLHEVPEIEEPAEIGERLFANLVLPDVQLDLAVAVADMSEHGFAHVPEGHDAPGQGKGIGGVAVDQCIGGHGGFEEGDRLGRSVGALGPGGIRLDSAAAELIRLLAANVLELAQFHGDSDR